MTQEFFNALKTECKNLRTLLTDEQKGKLNAKALSSQSDNCIYAKIFGNSETILSKDMKENVATIDACSPIAQELSTHLSYDRGDMTALENYLFFNGQGVVFAAKYIIPYIKGERKQFVAQKFL